MTAALSVLAALLILGGLYVGVRLVQGPAQAPEERTGSSAAAPTASRVVTPGADNPTSVGQAVDAIAQPAIAEVYGDAWLESAPQVEAPIVSLQYGIPANPVEGDAERLRDAFASRGARPDPANSEIDYHVGEEFMMLIDTGNPAYKSVRVSVSPEYRTVYVNADRSE